MAFFDNADEVSAKVPLEANERTELEKKLWPLESALAERYSKLAPQELQWETQQHQLIMAKPQAERKKHLGNKDIADALEQYPEKRVAHTRRLLFDFYVAQVIKDAKVKALRDQIAKVQKEHKARLMEVRMLATPLLAHNTRVFDRGDFLSRHKKSSRVPLSCCLPCASWGSGRSVGPGHVACVPRELLDAARCREPRVEAPVRPGVGIDTQRLRHPRRTPIASRAARLACRSLSCRSQMES